MLNKFVVIDLETTGNSSKKGDKIIQFAGVVIENGKITDSFSSLINPNQPIPVFIEELTGINDEMVKNAPLFTEIAAEVMSMLDQAYFVAHNVLFDLSFLQEELIQAGFKGFYGPVLDTVEMARILFPTADGYKLTDLAEQENLLHTRPHQADSDAQVTAELLLILLEKLTLLPQRTLSQLSQLSGGLKSDLQQLLDELLIEKGKTVEKIPASAEFFNGLMIKKYTSKSVEISKKISLKYPSNDIEKTKILQNAFPAYKQRKGQFKMMDGVYQSFLNGTHILIEAGTGVGKSLGYLIPAVFFSIKHNLPIIVSTHTIQLQEQLINKEVPLLLKMIPFQINAVLLKGTNNYISIEKFSYTLLEENDNYDTTLTKMQILVWLLETETGDKDEINLSSGGQLFWSKINHHYASSAQKGIWKEKDFYLRARKNAENADVIITNHSLLLSDVASNGSILPHYEYVIIDEGHHFEKAAAKFLGKSLDYLSTRLLLGQLGLFEQKQLFYKMEKLVETVQFKKEGTLHTFELNQLIVNLYHEIDELFKLIFLIAQKNSASKNSNRVKARLSSDEKSKEMTALIHVAERVAFLLKDIQLSFTERLNVIKKVSDSLSNEQKNVLKELVSFVSEIAELWETVNEIVIKEMGGVKWIETDLRSPQNVTTIYTQPTFVSEFLKSSFFQKKKSVVLTSATLTVNQSYNFIINELGLENFSTDVLTIPSPFHYKNQVQLLIPEDLPEIKSVSVDDYVVSITEHIITIAEATNGRMLLLFTSHEMLRKTYELIKESGLLDDFAIIAQGITSGSLTRLTRNFKRYEKAILLGTNSFWEGIDIPGEDLSCLIIVRLPFSPPDDPFIEAKCEYVKKLGGNPFTDYSLPEAILRFKQGFGRLIRTESDRGIIVVFDKRIVSTKYGRAFLKSIPEIPLKKGSIGKLIEWIHEWL